MRGIFLKAIFICTLLFYCSGGLTAQVKANADFKVKGFHIDLRIQIMKMPALKALALKLSKSGINTIIMEYEATFPYQKHPLIPNRYAYTKAELTDFIAYCSSLHIDVIPLQQSFGHVEYILQHQRYAKLREDQKDYSQINPLQEQLAGDLFKDLFTELEQVHTSKYIHIGCDETRLLGVSAASKEKVKKEGVAKLYGDYVAMICNIVLKMGKTPVLWADIALKYPDALQYLPKGVVFVDWNYGWKLDRFGDHDKLMKSGFEIWGSPALRSGPDNYNVTWWEKHFDNIRDFIPQARKLGYKGMVLTSWSTSGIYSYHWDNPDLIKLAAVRRVYPLSGFNILVDAFLQGVNTTAPLNIGSFINNYCKTNYGFNEQQSAKFWQALTAVPYLVGNGKVIDSKLTLQQMVDSARWVCQTFNTLNPQLNKQEFAHYKLMAGTRLNYLIFANLEYIANDPNFGEAQKNNLLTELKNLIKDTNNLNDEYIKINSTQYYVSELKEDNDLRIAKMQLLYDRLSRPGN